MNSSTDKGVTVSLHLSSPAEAVGEASDQEHSSAAGKKGMDDIACCRGLHCAAHSEHDRAGHSTHSRGASDTEVVEGDRRARGRSVPAGYTSPVRARIVIAHGFCVVFRLKQLVTSSYGDTGAFAFLVAWCASRLWVFGPLSSAPRRRSHQGESYIPLSSATCPQIVSPRGDMLACLFRSETKLRCMLSSPKPILN